MAVRANYVPDPSFESSATLTNWTEYNKNTNLYSYVDTSNKKYGTQSLRIQNAVTGDYGRTAQVTLPAGTYTAGAFAQTIAGTSGIPFVQCCFVVRRSSDLNVFVEQHWTTVNGTWTQKSQTFTLTSTTICDVLIGVGSYGTQSGGSARFDAISVTSGSLTDYFDGSGASSAATPANYTYAWTGTVNNSASTATDVVTGGGGGSGGGTTPTPLQGWDLVEHNDFSSGTVDSSRFFVYNAFTGTNGDGEYASSCVTQSGGTMIMQPSADNTAGWASQHRPIIYGKWVIRVKVTPIKGYKFVTFLWPDSEIWAEGEEDFFECTDPSGATFQIFFHKPGNPTDNSKQTRVTQDIHSDFVEMSIEWLPNRCTILMNGTKVYEVTDPAWIPTTARHLVAQIDVGVPDNKDGVSERDGYPAAVSPPFQAVIDSIDIYTPTTWYANGSAPAGLDAPTRQGYAVDIYNAWKASGFVQTGMPSGMPAGAYRVQRPENSNDTVSEGIGYGMIATAYYSNPALGTGVYDPAAKAIFDGLWTYYKFFRDSNGVMNWNVNSSGSVIGTGGATDADQDVGFALDLMDKINGSTTAFPYGTDSAMLWEAIGNTEYVPHSSGSFPDFMANGDQWGLSTNWYMPDYFHPAGMRSAYARSGDAAWLTRIGVNYPIARGYFDTNYTTGMVPDNCQRDGTAHGTDSYKFSYNAIRTWRTVLDFLWNGSNADTLAHSQATKLADFGLAEAGSTIANLRAEYNLDGTGYASYTNMAFVQAFGCAALADSANSTFAANCLTYLHANRAVSGNATYFGLSLGTIASLMMSGLMQPYTTAAPVANLVGTEVSTTTFSGSLLVGRNLAGVSSTTSGLNGALTVGRPLAGRASSTTAMSGSLSVAGAAPSIGLSGSSRSTSAMSGTLFGTPLHLGGISAAISELSATLSAALDLSVRPTVGSVAEELYDSLSPINGSDAENGWALLRFCAALTSGAQWTNDLVRDTDAGVGWSSVMDLDQAPTEMLPWLAQFVGVDTIPELDDESQRLRIRETAGFQRGTLSAIEGAARQYLTGSRTVVVQERDTSPYHLTVTTFLAETPDEDKIAQALQDQKPAGLVLQFVVSSGATCGALKATELTCAELDAMYTTPKAMKLAVVV